MLSEDSEINTCVLKSRARKKKLAPQFVVHRAVIVRVETTHQERELDREQNFRLNDIASRSPDGFYAEQILQGMNSTPMRRHQMPGLIHISAVTHINGVLIKTDLSRLSSKSIPAQHVVTVYPGCEKTRGSVQASIKSVALSGIRFADPIS